MSAAVTVRAARPVLRSAVVLPLALAAAVLVAWRVSGALPELRLGAVPFKGEWRPHVGPGVVPAVMLAAGLVCAGPRLAGRMRWAALVAGGAAATAVWGVVLAAGEGAGRLAGPLATRWEHLAAVPAVGTPGSFLETFVGRIPELPLHVQSHPPGTVLLFWGLDRLGLGGAGWAAALVVAAGASATAAVLLAVREVAGEPLARRAAPFLVLAPTAVWLVTSTDALYLGVGAWGVTAVVLATGRPGGASRLLAVAGGLVLGLALLLSYGLVLLAAVPGAVVVARRRWDVALLAVAAAAAVLGGVAAFGFSWADGLEATRRQYRSGVAAVRPYGWFLAVNLVAAAAAIGPAALAGLGRMVRRREAPGLALVVAAAVAAVLVADVSGMSKGEVERIWLPFLPWVVVAAAVVPAHRARAWLGASAGVALALQIMLRSPW